MVDLKQSVQYLKGVGPNRAKLLNLLGVYSVEDLINYYPRAYEDRTKVKKIYESTEVPEKVYDEKEKFEEIKID